VKWLSQIRDGYFPCPFCSHTYSYPERFLSAVFDQLGVSYCHDIALPWSQGKRYDFVIGDTIICETHGAQHYNPDGQFHADLSFDTMVTNDAFKRQLAADNGIDHYIVLDCRKSRLDFIRDSILSSDLSNLFDFSKIDWNACEKSCFSNSDYRFVESYNLGITSTFKIAEEHGVNRYTVLRALKRAAASGLCNYDPHEALLASQFKPKHKSEGAA